MIVAISLGLLGSFGHCVGMCSAVMLLIGRTPSFHSSKTAWVAAHTGRISSYTILGFFAGGLSQLVWSSIDELDKFQGSLALIAALIAIYFSLMLFGLVPTVEHLFSKLIHDLSLTSIALSQLINRLRTIT